jgi:hypothetical protein
MSLDAPGKDDALWDELRHVMRRHIKAGHDAIDTINRLLRKNPWLLESGSTLQIPPENLCISEESWQLDRLWLVLHSSQVVSDEPVTPEGAVVILRWGDQHYLMDGRRRINHWKRVNAAGSHRALVVERCKQ